MYIDYTLPSDLQNATKATKEMTAMSKWACSFAVCTVNRIFKQNQNIKCLWCWTLQRWPSHHPSPEAHGWLQLDNPPNHSKPMKLMIFLVMQDSCTSREYHCLLHFRWSQGPSLAPATWSPPSPRPTPSTHSGKPLANLHGATAFSRSLGHKRSYIREMNV